MAIQTTTTLSQVAQSARLDAGYHLAVRRAADSMPLFESLDAQAATAKAKSLVELAPPQVLNQALKGLPRGSSPSPNVLPSVAMKLAEEYPHLSLALLHKFLPEITKNQLARLKLVHDALNTLRDFNADIPRTKQAPGPRKPGP